MVENRYNGRENIDRYSRRGSRDIRFVPLDWQHPKDANGNYLPLRKRDPEDVGQIGGVMPDFSDVPDDQIGICVYNSTENAPVTSIYHDTAEERLALLTYCSRCLTVWSDYRADVETWSGMLFSNKTFSIDTRTRQVEFVD